MNNALKGLRPEKVFQYFEELSDIPRGSGNEFAASEYIMKYASDHGFDASRDDCNNVIMRKAASRGYEDAPVVMLQTHLDMVCEKVPGCEHDFLKDPIDLRIDNEKNVIYAEGTSLGADDGIGVAIVLAIFDDDTIVHPPLEAVFTTGEEIGFIGAEKFDMSQSKAKYIINSDSYRLDMVLPGCAGCAYTHSEQKITWEEPTALTSGLRITIGGLKGGHSGLDTTKQRANANILQGRFFNEILNAGYPVALSSYESINKDNAIARDAACVLSVKPGDLAAIKVVCDDFYASLKKELAATDPGLIIEISESEPPKRHITLNDMHIMTNYLMLVPNGMQTKDFFWNDPDLAESSVNLGRIIVNDESIQYRSMIRTNFESLNNQIISKFRALTSVLGMSFCREAGMPTWEASDNDLLEITKNCYKAMTGKDMISVFTHCSTECGHFYKGIGAEVVSIGADIRDLHSPSEEVDIDSVGGLYELNIRILAELAKIK